MIKDIYSRNKILANLGGANLILAVLLCIYALVNTETVLGINSMIKPIKFALSIWILSWTLAIFFSYINDQKKVRTFSKAAVIAYVFEEFAITSQAFRGELSHFNMANTYGMILFSLMGRIHPLYYILFICQLFLFVKKHILSLPQFP